MLRIPVQHPCCLPDGCEMGMELNLTHRPVRRRSNMSPESPPTRQYALQGLVFLFKTRPSPSSDMVELWTVGSTIPAWLLTTSEIMPSQSQLGDRQTAASSQQWAASA